MEAECRQGLQFTSELLEAFLCDYVGVGDAKIRVKLSHHLVCKGLLVDSNVCSMPNLVFEFRKHPAVKVLLAL